MENSARIAQLSALIANRQTSGLTQWIGLSCPSSVVKFFASAYQHHCTGEKYPTLDRFIIQIMYQTSKDPVGALLLGTTTVLLSLKVYKLALPFLIAATLAVLYREKLSRQECNSLTFAKNSPPRSQINSTTRAINTIVPLEGAPHVDYTIQDLTQRNALLHRIIQELPPLETSSASIDNSLLTKPQIDLLTHAHRIFECVFLGDSIAFLSIDKNSSQCPKEFQESIEKVYSNTLSIEQKNQYKTELDHLGSTELGFTRVISVRSISSPADNTHPFSIDRLQLEIDDRFHELPTEKLKKICEMIDTARGKGEPLLIHCTDNESNSAIVLMLYLMQTLNVSFEQTLFFLQTFRSQITVSGAMQGAIKNWDSTRVKKNKFF